MVPNFTNLFRSLTLSPAVRAIEQAHKMARRRIAAGGAARPTSARTEKKTEPADFVLPVHADPGRSRRPFGGSSPSQSRWVKVLMR